MHDCVVIEGLYDQSLFASVPHASGGHPVRPDAYTETGRNKELLEPKDSVSGTGPTVSVVTGVSNRNPPLPLVPCPLSPLNVNRKVRHTPKIGGRI